VAIEKSFGKVFKKRRNDPGASVGEYVHTSHCLPVGAWLSAVIAGATAATVATTVVATAATAVTVATAITASSATVVTAAATRLQAQHSW
jgi:hypothetical protein